MLHHFETTTISRQNHADRQPSSDPLEQHLAIDDVTMLVLATLAAVVAAVLLALGF